MADDVLRGLQELVLTDRAEASQHAQLVQENTPVMLAPKPIRPLLKPALINNECEAINQMDVEYLASTLENQMKLGESENCHSTQDLITNSLSEAIFPAYSSPWYYPTNSDHIHNYIPTDYTPGVVSSKDSLPPHALNWFARIHLKNGVSYQALISRFDTELKCQLSWQAILGIGKHMIEAAYEHFNYPWTHFVNHDEMVEYRGPSRDQDEFDARADIHRVRSRFGIEFCKLQGFISGEQTAVSLATCQFYQRRSSMGSSPHMRRMRQSTDDIVALFSTLTTCRWERLWIKRIRIENANDVTKVMFLKILPVPDGNGKIPYACMLYLSWLLLMLRLAI